MVQTNRKMNVAVWAILMSFVLVFALAVAVIAAPSVKSASADDTYSYMGWDEESGGLVERETDSTPTAVTSSMTELSAGWYIVDDDVTIESTVTVNSGGVINLILVDGKTLTINAPYGNNPLRLINTNTTLNIYGQAAGTGELHIESNYGCGIYASSSYVNVYGGKVYAKAQENCNGSYGIMCKTLTVYGGQVTALGYDWNDYKGIGIVGNLVMYGGEVIAKAGSEKAIYGTITAGEDIDWVILKSTDNGSSWSTISLDENNKCSNSDYHVKVMVRAKMVGYGYSNNPYKISTADQLNRFRDIVNGLNDEAQNKFAWAVLMNDVDLEGSESNQWTPIGNSSSKYGGTFDGNGHTISGLYINSDSEDKIGFISYTGPAAKIKNLTLEGSVTATSNYANVGAFVGSMGGGLLTDCTNKATVNGVMYVGGLVGCVSYDSSNKAKVEKSVNQGAVTGTFSGAGGIAGNNYGIVENCYNTGTVTGVDQVGGIIGLANYLTPTNFSTTSCNFNYGTISGSGSTVGNVIGSSSNNPTVESNFYLSATPNKGIGNRDEDTTKTQVLTADEFKDATNFVGFDFLEVWKMGENYPLFAKAYDLWIGNDLVTESRLSGEGWSFAPETNTLTLDGYTLSVDGRAVPDLYKHYAAFTYLGDETLNLVLVGENSITNTIDALNVFAFYSNSPVTISGTGSLYLTTTGSVTNSKALGTKGVLTINGGTVVAQGGPATVFDGTATSTGVSVEGGLVLNGGSLTAIAGESLHYSYGLQCFHGDEYDLVIGEGIKSFVAQGGEIVGDQPSMHKSYSIYANAVSIELDGTSWTDIAGTEGEAAIEAGTYNSNPFGDYLKVEFISGTMITIEIADKEINYNEDAPTYTYVAKIDGEVVTDEDLLAAIAAKLTVGSAYAKGSNAGSYDIVNSNAQYNEKFTVADEDYIISSIVGGTLTVNKINAVVTAPTAKTGLHYTGVAQELVNAGSTTGGTIEYKLNDGEWSTAIPTAINVDDDYIVSYRVVGGTNFNDIAGVALSEAIEIEENDKTVLTSTLERANSYYDTIAAAHPTVADVLDDVIDDANAVLNNENKTEEEISTAVEALAAAVLNAQVGVVEEKIDAIPSPVTLDSEDEIIAAREAYDNLSDDQQTQVINRDALFAAEIDLAEALIADIGEVVYTTGCKGKIDKARDYFDGLDEDEQALIGEDVAQALEDAEEAYDKLAADNAAADAVDALIAQIDDPVVYPTSGAGIQAARTAYNALTDDQKALVDDYSDLTTAENEYNAQKNAGVEDVEGLIDAIGKVTYPDSKNAIDAAREAFDALTEEQQTLVDDEHKDALADAEAAYKALEDVAKANAAKALIEAIGEVEDTQSSKDKIDAARDAYDALTDDQKALIAEDEQTIVTAEATYTTLHANNLAAAEVVALINAIGTVEYTETSKCKIDAAREGYDALTDDQKALVNEDLKDTLTAAEESYAALKADADAAAEVIALITAIGEVEYTAESKAKIDAAMTAFGALTPAQKELVENHAALPTAEETYSNLADQAKAQGVITKISAIGEVKYPESKDLIQEARTAYDELTVPQKEMVENYEVLEAAEATYAELEAEANKGLSGGAIAGIVIGCFFGLLLIAFIILFILYKRDKDKEEDKKLIKVPFINNLMAKVDCALTKAWNAIVALWNKIFQKEAQPAAEDIESPAEDVPAEAEADPDPKEDNE